MTAPQTLTAPQRMRDEQGPSTDAREACINWACVSDSSRPHTI
ncbi:MULTISPECIES: hypothetical protein [unclassified Nonomuraea]